MQSLFSRKPVVATLLRGWGTALSLLFLALLSNGLEAQGTPSASLNDVINSDQDITFQLLSQAPYRSSYSAEQTRRFRNQDGSFTEVRERLVVNGNGSRSSPFKLDFLGVIGRNISSLEVQRWNGIYRRYASLFYEHGSFRVTDPIAAARNYMMFFFGPVVRTGRSARRVVVCSPRLDKSLWVVDLDVETGVPLYAGEFGPLANLVGELEVTSFQLGVLPRPANFWHPLMSLTFYQDPMVAIGSFPMKGLIQPTLGSLMSDYALGSAQVSQNLLNNERSLVLSYTDGIDEFFVMETPGLANPFALAPSNLGKSVHTIAYYDDPSMRVYQFFEQGVTFQVAGRGTLSRLDPFSRQVYQEAFHSH